MPEADWVRRDEDAARGEIDRMGGGDVAALAPDLSDRPGPLFRLSVPEKRAGEITVLVLHSSALVAAGLVASLSRLTGWTVRTPDETQAHAPRPKHLRGVDVVITDAEWLAVKLQEEETRLGPGRRPGPRFVLVDEQSTHRTRGTTWSACITARLSVHCTEEELVQVVRDAAGIATGWRWVGRRLGEVLRGGLAPTVLHRVKAYLGQQLAGRIELRDLATIAGLSECHFSRAFKESMGLPPHRYLLMRRVAVAAELLASTERPLNEISRVVGFVDQSHLGRVFRKIVGETPSLYRRRHR
jgi:AraC-like DNA-binding protein